MKNDVWARAEEIDELFPKDPDTAAERAFMEKACSDVEDDLDDEFWIDTMTNYIGYSAVQNAEVKSLKAAAAGDALMSEVWQGIAELRQRLEAKAENDKGALDLIERVKYA